MKPQDIAKVLYFMRTIEDLKSFSPDSMYPLSEFIRSSEEDYSFLRSKRLYYDDKNDVEGCAEGDSYRLIRQIIKKTGSDPVIYYYENARVFMAEDGYTFIEVKLAEDYDKVVIVIENGTWYLA